MPKYRTLGILGGMGPEATALLFNLIIENTPAKSDSEHIPICIYNLPQIPDRTRAILHDGPSPVPMLLQGIRVLEQTPASCILIPCNTIFYFYPQFAPESRLPIVHLLKAVIFEIVTKYGKQQKTIGILATRGSQKSKIYDHFLREAGFAPIYPAAHTQETLMQEIYQIKAGQKDFVAARHAGEELMAKGATCVVLGCTELSLIYKSLCQHFPVIDSLRALANVGIQIARGLRSPEEYSV